MQIIIINSEISKSGLIKNLLSITIISTLLYIFGIYLFTEVITIDIGLGSSKSVARLLLILVALISTSICRMLKLNISRNFSLVMAAELFMVFSLLGEAMSGWYLTISLIFFLVNVALISVRIYKIVERDFLLASFLIQFALLFGIIYAIDLWM